MYILDGDLQLAPMGAAGELCIGGAGLSRGYLGRDDLTAERFLTNQFATGPKDGRLYRTGDLARFTLDGQVEYLGRIDTQVKIRGFRVELSEIESVLMRHPDILTAVVAVRREQDIQQLVGYVIPKAGHALDEDAVREWLRTTLPAYMVPSLLESVDTLPTLPSGKVDRKSLPAPKPRKTCEAKPTDAGVGPLEQRIINVWRELLVPLPVSRTDDFFLDLGGHSLLAARMVSQLRKESDFADLSVLDVYSFPTPQSLAAELEARRNIRIAATRPANEPHSVRPTSRLGYVMCVLAQTVSLFFIAGLFSMQWLTPYMTYCWLAERGMTIVDSLAVALATLLVFYPLLMVVSVVIKWAVIGRFRAGVYPLWGWYYFRWWFVNQVLSVVPVDYMAGTPLLAWYYRLMGAHIGRNVYFGTDNVSAFDMVSVGDDSCIGLETMLMGYCVEDGFMRLGPVSVGKRCFIGSRAVLRPGTIMEDDARLEDLSLLSENGRIPAGQTWLGSPARPKWKTDESAEDASHVTRPGRLRKAVFTAAYALGVLLVPAVCLTSLFPGLIWLNYATHAYAGYWFLLFTPVMAVMFVLLMAAQIVLVKWLLLGRVTPGTYSLYSSFYLRKWFFDQLMDLSLDLLGPLYATLYLSPWYRLLGAKMGRRAEISTASATSPDLLQVGDESFIADAVCLGASRVEGGMITIAPTVIGKRAFVGNSAFVPAGAAIGDDVLIGCMSAPPVSAADAARAGTSWLGSPSFFLPQRQAVAGFTAGQTFNPPRRLVMLRAFIEFFRITLPLTCFIILTSLLITVFINISLMNIFTTLGLAVIFPVLYLAFGAAAAMIVVACKWLLMGRYKPDEKPLWSSFVWRTELVTAMHEHLADPFLVLLLLGTPWASWFFRLLGAKVGRRVFLETTCLTEFDLITIGDEATLGSECTIQTHLFEDRVMKMSTIDIGDGCSVGAGSIVLYDTRMESGASLGDLSLLMKGENLPADTQWEGTPARLLQSTSVAQSADEPAKIALSPITNGQSESLQVRFLFGLDEYDPRHAGPWVWVLGLDAVPSPGRDMARRLVGIHLDISPQDVVFDIDPHGGTTLAADKMSACPRAADLRLNFAHSERMLVAGVSFTGRIGVDVEMICPAIDVDAISRDHLTTGERLGLQALSQSERTAGFYKIWTAKEAFVKAIRQGMFFGLDQVEMVLDSDGTVSMAGINGSRELARGWRIAHHTITVGGRRAIAAVVMGDQ